MSCVKNCRLRKSYKSQSSPWPLRLATHSKPILSNLWMRSCVSLLGFSSMSILYSFLCTATHDPRLKMIRKCVNEKECDLRNTHTIWCKSAKPHISSPRCPGLTESLPCNDVAPWSILSPADIEEVGQMNPPKTSPPVSLETGRERGGWARRGENEGQQMGEMAIKIRRNQETFLPHRSRSPTTRAG